MRNGPGKMASFVRLSMRHRAARHPGLALPIERLWRAKCCERERPSQDHLYVSPKQLQAYVPQCGLGRTPRSKVRVLDFASADIGNQARLYGFP